MLLNFFESQSWKPGWENVFDVSVLERMVLCFMLFCLGSFWCVSPRKDVFILFSWLVFVFFYVSGLGRMFFLCCLGCFDVSVLGRMFLFFVLLCVSPGKDVLLLFSLMFRIFIDVPVLGRILVYVFFHVFVCVSPGKDGFLREKMQTTPGSDCS